MSVPIFVCRFYLAFSDPVAFDALVKDLKFNQVWGAYTQFPCPHDPPHPQLTPEQVTDLNARLSAAVKAASAPVLEPKA